MQRGGNAAKSFYRNARAEPPMSRCGSSSTRTYPCPPTFQGQDDQFARQGYYSRSTPRHELLEQGFQYAGASNPFGNANNADNANLSAAMFNDIPTFSSYTVDDAILNRGWLDELMEQMSQDRQASTNPWSPSPLQSPFLPPDLDTTTPDSVPPPLPPPLLPPTQPLSPPAPPPPSPPPPPPITTNVQEADIATRLKRFDRFNRALIEKHSGGHRIKVLEFVERFMDQNGGRQPIYVTPRNSDLSSSSTTTTTTANATNTNPNQRKWSTTRLRVNAAPESATCALCGRTYSTVQKVSSHLLSTHIYKITGEHRGLFECADCKALYMRSNELRRHRQKRHGAPTATTQVNRRCAQCTKQSVGESNKVVDEPIEEAPSSQPSQGTSNSNTDTLITPSITSTDATFPTPLPSLPVPAPNHGRERELGFFTTAQNGSHTPLLGNNSSLTHQGAGGSVATPTPAAPTTSATHPFFGSVVTPTWAMYPIARSQHPIPTSSSSSSYPTVRIPQCPNQNREYGNTTGSSSTSQTATTTSGGGGNRCHGGYCIVSTILDAFNAL